MIDNDNEQLIASLISQGVVRREHLSPTAAAKFDAEFTAAEQAETDTQDEPKPEDGKLARGNNGRFIKKNAQEEALEKSARFGRDLRSSLQNTLMSDPVELENTPAKTVVERVVRNLMARSAEAGTEDLSGASKALDTVIKWSAPAEEVQGQTQIKVITWSTDGIPEGTCHTKIEKQTKPSWVTAEVVSTDGPSHMPDNAPTPVHRGLDADRYVSEAFPATPEG